MEPSDERDLKYLKEIFNPVDLAIQMFVIFSIFLAMAFGTICIVGLVLTFFK